MGKSNYYDKMEWQDSIKVIITQKLHQIRNWEFHNMLYGMSTIEIIENLIIENLTENRVIRRFGWPPTNCSRASFLVRRELKKKKNMKFLANVSRIPCRVLLVICSQTCLKSFVICAGPTQDVRDVRKIFVNPQPYHDSLQNVLRTFPASRDSRSCFLEHSRCSHLSRVFFVYVDWP